MERDGFRANFAVVINKKTSIAMTTNEETIAMGGEKKEVKKSNASREWKNVAIGGVTGIMFGAGTAYAASKLAGDDDSTEGNHAGTGAGTHDVTVDSSDVVAVNEGQSFSDAFAQARAEVGPGGVFRWHGGVYGTYTKEEWEAMSPEEQRQFSQNAMSAAENAGEGSSVHVSTNGGTHVDPHTPEPEPTPDPTSHPGPKPTVNDPEPTADVHVVGVHDEQLADGSVVTVGKLEGDGIDSDILVVDVDRDSVFDVAISDVNSNSQIDEGEIADISGAGLRVPNVGMDPNVHTAQNDIAPDMPDYMNDADVQMA